MLCGLALLLVLGPSAPADPAAAPVTIAVTEADVWSLPGDGPRVYATGKLRQASPVTVLKTLEGGWLAIKPPEGSIDWVNDQALTVNGGVMATVKAADVPTRIGIVGQTDAAGFSRATIEGVRLQPGSLVLVAGQAITAADGSKWWPIQPPPAEERYLRAEALQAAAAAPAAPPARAAETPPAMPIGNEPLWVQAQQAEQAGNYAEAERLYTQLARQTPNHDLALQCYNRVQYLRERTHGQGAPGYPVGYPAQANYPGSTVSPVGTAPPQPPPSSLPPATPPGPITVGQAPAIGYPAAPNAQPAQQSSGRGWLRRAGFYLDNKPTYVLQSTEGRPPLYLTAQGQLNLEQYLFRNVELYGPIYYRGDVKANYMTAVHIVLVP
jgi:hypothetical protein